MSVYTPLSNREMASFFAPFELGSVAHFEGTDTGIENTNFFLTSSTQKDYVLTLFESLTVDSLPGFIQLMRHLANAKLPVPMPIADKHHNVIHQIKNKPAMLFPRLEGKHITAPKISHCIQMGSIIGQLHEATRTFTSSSLKDYTLPWAQKQVPSLLESINNNNAFSNNDSTLLKEISQDCGAFLENNSALPSGIIHGDLFYDNALFTSSNTHEILSGIIDFYHAGPGFLIYDLAVAVNDWCIDHRITGENRTLDKNKVAAMLGSYQKIRPLSNIEQQAWPKMLVFAAYRFWVSRLLGIIKQTKKSEQTFKAKNPDEFKHLMINNRA